MTAGEYTSILHEALHNIARSATARHDRNLPGCGAHLHANTNACATSLLSLFLSLSRVRIICFQTSHYFDIILAPDVLLCSLSRSPVFSILTFIVVYSEEALNDTASNVRVEIHLCEDYQSIATSSSLLHAYVFFRIFLQWRGREAAEELNKDLKWDS